MALVKHLLLLDVETLHIVVESMGVPAEIGAARCIATIEIFHFDSMVVTILKAIFAILAFAIRVYVI